MTCRIPTKTAIKKMKSGDFFDIPRYEEGKAFSRMPIGVSFRKMYVCPKTGQTQNLANTGADMVRFSSVRFIKN